MGRHSPSLVLVEFVAHSLAKLFEFALLFCIVCLNESDLEEPEPPREVLEALALLEVGSDLCANFPCTSKSFGIANLRKRTERFVALRGIYPIASKRTG